MGLYQNTINNILVVDKIPDNTAFSWIDHNYQGQYIADGNYVRFVVDKLLPDQTALLAFKVKVTAQIMDDSSLIIENKAHYDNFAYKIDDLSKDKQVLQNNNITNIVKHEVVGVKIDVLKTSDPVDGSLVNSGQVITYNVSLINNGTVKANYLRVRDEIPAGTTYVDGSLNLTTDNPSSDQKYAFSHGEAFDIHYDLNNKAYYLNNIGDIKTASQKPAQALQVSWRGDIKLVKQDIPTGWKPYNVSGKTVYFQITNNNSQKTIKDYLASLRFSGEYGTNGQIVINVFDAAMICRFDENGVIHFYQYINGSYDWNSANSKANASWFAGLQGYLATITSAQEMTFLQTSVATKEGWIGSRYTGGYWKWVTGPEKGEAWWKGTNHGTSIGKYSHWNNGEPNNSGGNEDCVVAYYSTQAWWNDWAAYQKTGYYVEYSDGYNGHYMPKSKYATSLPTPSSSGGCKYVSDKGKPYVECVSADVEPEKTATMTFKVKVNNPLSAGINEIVNVAYFENSFEDLGYAGTKDEAPAKPSNMTIHPLEGKQPIITATKDSDPKSGSIVDINDQIIYKIKVENTGGSIAKFVRVKEYLPQHTSYVPKSISHDGFYHDEGEKSCVEWLIQDLGVNEEVELYYAIKVNEDAPLEAKIERAALYELYYADPYDDNLDIADPKHQTNETLHLLQAKDEKPETMITVIKQADPASGTDVKRLDNLTYQLKVTNNSKHSTAKFILVKDKLPKGTSLLHVKAIPDVVTYQVNDDIYWEITNLAPEKSIFLEFVVTVLKDTNEKAIVNYANFGMSDKLLSQEDKEAILTNKTNIINHPIYEPKVEVLKKSDPISGGVVGRGRIIAYELIVENTSNALANHIVLVDEIPEGTTLVDNSITCAKQDHCGLSHNKQQINAIINDLSPHQKRKLSFKVRVDDDVKDGKMIYNQAFFEIYHQDIVNIDDPLFPVVSQPTNETIHYVQIGTDVLPTGGPGHKIAYYVMVVIMILWGTYLLRKH
ncbi:MAG: hypothetical protein MR210_02525 [Erysipelotrichaceae bacterium]|nr:hypothetical protein [Erysipelotrichaceae bacterium]MDY5252607.1 lectin-like protein [Erysipelotrichaceae bacterium]